MSNAPVQCREFPEHRSSNSERRSFGFKFCIDVNSWERVSTSRTSGNASLPRERPGTSKNVRERPHLGGPGSLGGPRILDVLGSLGSPGSLGDALGGMDHGLGLGVGVGVRVGWRGDVAQHVENSFSQGGSIQEDFDDENIGGKDFKNAHEIDSEFESNDDNAYNSSEEEDDEYIDDDGDDMSIKNLYCDSTWSQKFNTYNLGPQDFVSASGCSIQWPYFPSFIILFQIFWP